MKYIKWFIISSFLILFMGVCNIVSALEMETTAIPSTSITGYDTVGYGSFMKNNINSKNNFDVVYTFNADNNISGYDYIQFPFIIQYSNTTTGSINGDTYSNVTDLWCTNWTQRTQTYADGSTSTYSECSLWSTQVNPTESSQLDTFEQNTPNISIAIDMIYNNGKISPCELTSVNYGTTYFKCKVPSNATTINRIRMRNQGSNYINSLIGQLGIGNYYIKWKDPINSVISEQQETNNELQDMNENITSSDVSGASQDQNNIVNNPAFQDNTGLSGIITAPLSMISSLTNQCQPIQLTLPYLKNTNVSIPCMGNFLQSKVPALVTLLKVFVNGFICYLIGLDLFKIVKNARDPDNDRIEVLDL